jgi:hypothetical protein
VAGTSHDEPNRRDLQDGDETERDPGGQSSSVCEGSCAGEAAIEARLSDYPTMNFRYLLSVADR